MEFSDPFTGDRESWIQTVKSDGRLDLVYKVHPDTVGECTGLSDRNGKLIFEGDMVISTNSRRLSNKPQAVEFDPLSGYWMCDPKRKPLSIGNIHDNPELLEVQNNG